MQTEKILPLRGIIQKQRADLKKQLSLGKTNTRRQTEKMTIQQIVRTRKDREALLQ